LEINRKRNQNFGIADATMKQGGCDDMDSTKSQIIQKQPHPINDELLLDSMCWKIAGMHIMEFPSTLNRKPSSLW
jgi:hypothetical protein